MTESASHQIDTLMSSIIIFLYSLLFYFNYVLLVQLFNERGRFQFTYAECSL
jgi:uncharacterized membrane protein (GlpM family)